MHSHGESLRIFTVNVQISVPIHIFHKSICGAAHTARARPRTYRFLSKMFCPESESLSFAVAKRVCGHVRGVTRACATAPRHCHWPLAADRWPLACHVSDVADDTLASIQQRCAQLHATQVNMLAMTFATLDFRYYYGTHVIEAFCAYIVHCIYISI